MGLESVAGGYTISAINVSSGCTANMPGSVTVNIVPLPTIHNVTGGGGFCAGGSGVPVGLDGSEIGFTYQLKKNGTSLGTSTLVYGTGSPLNYGLMTALGSYTIEATNMIVTTPACQNNMYGAADVHYDTILTPSLSIQAFPSNGLGVWQVDSVKVYVTNGGSNPTFQWYVNCSIHGT